MEEKDVIAYLDQIYYSAEGEELEFISNVVNGVLIDAKHFDKIDVTNIKPADWPFECEIDYLREDEVKDELTLEEVTKNAAQSQDNYVKYIKVV